MDVWEYFDQKEREYRNLSLTPDREYGELFAERAGSHGQVGRIFGNLHLNADIDAFIAVSEWVVVRDNYVERIEYGYFLIIDGQEIWGYENDPTHDPPVHRHTEGHRERLLADRVSFRQVAEEAWREVSNRVLAP